MLWGAIPLSVVEVSGIFPHNFFHMKSPFQVVVLKNFYPLLSHKGSSPKQDSFWGIEIN